MSGFLQRRDVVPVVVLALLAAADCAANPSSVSPVPAALLGVATALPLLVRRRAPVAATLVLTAIVLVRAVAGAIPYPTTSTLPLLVFAVFAVVVHAARLRDGILAGAACLAGTIVGIATTTEEPIGPLDLLVVSVLIAAAGVGGGLVRRRAAETGRLREHGRAAEAAREAEAREAVAAERARIARELHDVLAHSVSIISVQAGAAERQALRDPERARAAVAQVRQTAHEAQADLVRLLEVLRGDAAVVSITQPGLEDLEGLVGQARAAGLPIDLEVDPALGAGVPDGVALAAYRIVQEALTNVRKHAGVVPTDVRLAAHGDGLHVDVVNVPGTGRGGGSGLGLIGMDERVRVHGGELRAGPDATGHWTVHAVLPMGAP